jgi:hypothetical protein
MKIVRIKGSVKCMDMSRPVMEWMREFRAALLGAKEALIKSQGLPSAAKAAWQLLCLRRD